MYFSLFKETKNFDFYCMFFSAVCVAQGYHITVCSLAKWRKSKHKCSILHKSSIEVLPLNLALNPPFCQTAVLVAQLLKYTKKKLHKNYRFCIFNHARKKEFHASIIRFG